MTTPQADLLLHPVRLRVVLAMGGEDRTTADLQSLLADVPPATLYRHVAALFDGGILEVVDERRNRGGLERTYRLVEEAATVGREDAVSLAPEQHLSAFVAFTGSLIEAMTRFLQHPDGVVGEQPFGYHQVPLWLSDEEAQQMSEELSDVVRRYRVSEPAPDSTRVTLTTVLIPELG